MNAKRTNVDFQVNGKALGQKLASLSAADPVATQLNATLNQLWNNDATNRRNEVTHQLAQVADGPAVFYYQLGRVRHRQIQSWEMKSYHSNAAPFQARDLTMRAIVEQTFRAIVGARP